MSQREVSETLGDILKEVLQVWLVRKSPPSQGNLPLTQTGYPKSTGGQQDSKSQNISEPPGESQVHIPVIIQLDHQIYQSQSILKKC